MTNIRDILDDEKKKVISEHVEGKEITNNLGAFLSGMEYFSEVVVSKKYNQNDDRTYFVHLVHTKGQATIPLSDNDILRIIHKLHKKKGPIRFRYHLENHGWKTIYLEALLIQGNVKRKDPKEIII